MQDTQIRPVLTGFKALVIGVANEHSIAYGCARAFRTAGADMKDFDLLLNEAAHKAPLGELVDIMDVGFTCAYLATPFARRITGGTVYVDGGANIVA